MEISMAPFAIWTRSIRYNSVVGIAGSNVVGDEWPVMPTSIFGKRSNMRKSMVGRSQRQAAGRIFMERSGVVAMIAKVAGFGCFRLRAFRKIMRGGFAVPSIVVRTEGATK
jgi:hypothetical protein